MTGQDDKTTKPSITIIIAFNISQKRGEQNGRSDNKNRSKAGLLISTGYEITA